MAIKKAAVIGAGVMGAGIAAHLANAGYEVELLDRVDPKNPGNRTAIAEGAIEKLLKTNPAPLMHKKNARKIRPGNTEDNMDRLSDVDIIIEAVFEDPKVKSDIFKKIDANRKPGSIVASNTSTIPLKDLIADQSDALKKDFVITHFFNPPRYMPLLELVTSEHNDPAMVADLTRFLDEKLGKGVVHCNDTPGFIANRIGTFWIQSAINEAIARKISVEEADAIVGKPMGVPKTGIFGLVDLVGLDLMPHISKSLMGSLPAEDAYVKSNRTHPVIDTMIKEGYTGRKGKGGFYRRDENKNDFAVDLETGALHPKTKVVPAKSTFAKASTAIGRVLSAPLKLFSKKKEGADRQKPIELEILNASKKGGLRALVEHDDKYGEYA
ncbi:MAG: 3-hydroxyacyl-CoA dehydrogenase family protein, partial [Alphaproteobacteria bacterium]|nr:3-hydroxyacyl-CoA dehydrogenase family protein [Alphaproteobacteria bacterium]